MNDKINHPSHYTAYPIEVIEITEQLSFLEGNIVKYLLRYPFKNGVEDLKKAEWYLKRLSETSDIWHCMQYLPCDISLKPFKDKVNPLVLMAVGNIIAVHNMLSMLNNPCEYEEAKIRELWSSALNDIRTLIAVEESKAAKRAEIEEFFCDSGEC